MDQSFDEAARIVYLSGSYQGDSGARDVERLNHHAFYELGRTIKQVSRHSGQVPRHEPVMDLFEAQSTLGRLLQGVPVPLQVSSKAARDLHSHIENILEVHYYVSDEKGERKFRYPEADASPIDGWYWHSLSKHIETFETVFSAEMADTTTYWIPRRGIYFTPALVDSADQSFPTETASVIPEKTKVDWRASGRCLAFSLHTASGFHAARAVEGMLEVYYQLFSGKPDETLRSWYDYIKALEGVAEKKIGLMPSAKTLSELDQMRTYDRNPIMHPRVVLSESDARVLFGSSEALIIGMAQEMTAAKNDSALRLLELAG